MKTLADILPIQSHYYLLRLKKPSRHGKYALHGKGDATIGLLVFPLLEKAEQFCLTVARGLGKPERVSAEKFMKLAEAAKAICLADGPKVMVAVMHDLKEHGAA